MEGSSRGSGSGGGRRGVRMPVCTGGAICAVIVSVCIIRLVDIFVW